MNKTIRISAFLALITSCAIAQEQDSLAVNALKEVVVSDTKFAQNREKSGKVIEVISAADLEKKSGQSLATVLSQVAGVEINGNQSANGKNLGYYIRGGKNRQVLILIDGIPVTDASGISFEYDLRLLPVEQVEKIEIMKGAASTLYGTGAATGVINITLKKGSKKEIEGNVYMNIGSNNTANNLRNNGQEFNQGISVNGTVNKVNYFAGLNTTETNGMSQIGAPTSDTDYETDRFSRQNLLAKIGFKAIERLSLDFFTSYDKINNDYDLTFDNTGDNDTDVNETTSEQLRFGLVPKYQYTRGEFVLNTGFTKATREYDEWNTYSGTVDHSFYESRNLVVDGLNKYNFSTKLSLILGANFQFFDMKTQTPFSTIEKENTRFNILDGYTTLVYNSNFGMNINTGARWNHHSAYGNNAVFNFNPSFNFKTHFPLKVLASYSTAYVTPSLYQLYSEYGNGNLMPEKNATMEVGFETELLNKKVTLNTVAFYREQSDAIDFYFDATTFDAYYRNISGDSKAKGVETAFQYAVTPQLQFNANYTFTQVDKALDRLIPKHKVNTSFDFQPNSRTLFNVSYQYFDARNDAFYDANTFSVLPITLGSYKLLNTLVKYVLIKNRMTVFASATNILNEEFVENVGYSTRGRNFKLGVNLIL
jgi:vitamin B12 transporter